MLEVYGDVHRVLAVSGRCTQGVGSFWEMYTGCWQFLGDVHRVLEVYGDVHSVLAVSEGCIQI